jgi:predicted ABC-type sugar transport system permease subunit
VSRTVLVTSSLLAALGASATASRLNRDAAPMGKVFVVNAVNVPQP